MKTPKVSKSGRYKLEGRIGRFARGREKKRGARGALPVGKTDPRQRDDEIRSYEFRLPHEGNPDSP